MLLLSTRIDRALARDEFDSVRMGPSRGSNLHNLVPVNGDRTAHRTCPLCEATCGLEVTLAGGDAGSLRGDRDDVFSRGFICPKGYALKELHSDPDRLRTPLIKRADGAFVEASWGE